MKNLSLLVSFYFSLFPLLLFGETKAGEQAQNKSVYVVYMGAATWPNGTSRDDHSQLVTSLSRRKSAVVQTYKHGFSGFAARLTKEEADSIARRPGVVSVFPDPVLDLHTTRSWDFLRYQTDLEIDSTAGSDNDSFSQGSDTIIGILDTGISPESQSFNDKGMGPIPSRWKGTCMEGQDFTSAHCNRKLIGARYYNDPEDNDPRNRTPRDKVGHGTHVASIAGGSPVPGASYYGLALGTAKGGSPTSRIAIYSACKPTGCSGSAILAAFDDAIADGVDVLSVSLGSSDDMTPDFSSDPIAIGAFHAVEKGITVVCSAGNGGPTPQTVANVAPWILTVAATTIDRDFQSDLVLGNNKVIKGGGIHFGDIQKHAIYPMIYGMDAKLGSNYIDDDNEARNCNPGALDEEKVKGKIVVCDNDNNRYSVEDRIGEVTSQGGIGVVLVDDEARIVASSYGSSPVSVISSNEAAELRLYLDFTRYPVGTILPTVSLTNYKPAPRVAFFSSRGPSFSTKRILKPDIAAPGVDILAAWPGKYTEHAIKGKGTPLFHLLSGTSMSCPHVSGIAATVKSKFPNWSPSAIKSAIMTTATQTNNMKGTITTDSRSVATPYDYGAGEVITTGPLQPGLVYETNTIEYLEFFCNYGYDTSSIHIMSSQVPDRFKCSENARSNLISNMNYPSIAISHFDAEERKKVIRTVTNVGVEDETLYIASISAPIGLDVKVIPDKLQFTKTKKKLSYEVIFASSTASTNTDMFGSITWCNGKYRVRSPFVVSS